MSYLGVGDPGLHSPLFSRFRETFGFVPALFRAQAVAPAIVEAEIGLLEAVVHSNTTLSRMQKESILLVAATSQRNDYLVAGQYQSMQMLGIPEHQVDAIIADCSNADLKPATATLLEFTARFSRGIHAVSNADVQRLSEMGLSAEAIQEAIAACAIARFLGCIAIGLGVAPDFSPRALPDASASIAGPVDSAADALFTADRNDDNPLLAGFRTHFGCVPGWFSAQHQAPHILTAELRLLDAIFRSGGLNGMQKHSILFAAFLAGGNACGLSLQDSVLRSRGRTESEIDRLASSLTATEDDSGFLLENFAARLIRDAARLGREQVEAFEAEGLREEQIVEAVVTASLGAYVNVLQSGLNIRAGSPLRPVLQALLENKLNLVGVTHRPTLIEPESDADSVEVDRVQNGDIDAFEILVERHGRRVYRTLIGLLGNADEARDAMQDTFLKAFQHIGGFQRRSKFSTWLLSIGTNTGVQRLRERRDFEAIDESPAESSDFFRPRQIRAWADDPEKLYSQAEMRAVVEKGIMSLPSSYRVVLMLRDIEQLPIEDVASGLGLTISAAKSRLLRGRLMLREALSPHFAPAEGSTPAKQVHA